VEKEILDETEYDGGNNKTQDIKTCGSAGHKKGESGEEDENYNFFSHYKGIIYVAIAGSLEEETVENI
jgi:hypothetical protein